MKHMKRFMALFAALALVFAMAVPAWAAEVTVDPSAPQHTYVAYQIFTGTQQDGETALGNPAWGSGINKGNFVQALIDNHYYTSVASTATAQSVVEALSVLNSEQANVVAKLAYANKFGTGTTLTTGENTLANGYYLIVDTYTQTGTDEAVNAALLQVTKDIKIQNKTDKPSVEKKVKENVKYAQNGGYGDGYNDVADYNMGDAVPFRLIGKIPDMSQFDTYKYTFVDKYSAGLNAPQNIQVTLSSNKKPGTKILVQGTDYTYTLNDASHTFQIHFNDLKSIVGTDTASYKYVVVSYTAVLNQNAVVGLDGNPNEVYLTYSNNPNASGDDTPENGKTPEDKVIVFTYELDATKVDKADHNIKLKNVEFKLKNSNNKYAVVDTNGKVTSWDDSGSTLKSDDNGKFSVIGLDDGEYTLVETKPRDGYNSIPDTEFKITATTKNDQNWISGIASEALTKLTIKVGSNEAQDGNTSTGAVDLTIENSKGMTLPTTGGIGTTIFYVIGGGLMVAAAVLLIAKKRMENK